MARLHKVEDPASHIRNAAIELIAKHGIDKFSARVLAKKVKYSHGTIFKYFKNIDELMIRINTETLVKLRDNLNEIKKDEIAGLNKLIHAAQSYLEFVEENLHLWGCVMDASLKGNKEVRRLYDAELDKLMAVVAEMVKPHLRKNQDIEVMTNLLWAGLQGIYQISRRESSGVSPALKQKKLAQDLVNELFG